MDIEFVGGATASKVGATSGNSTIALSSGLTGGIASAVAAGDLVIAVYGTGSTADRTLAITDGNTAYTLIGAEQYQDDTFDTNLRCAYKFMGATPDASTTFGPTRNASDAGAMAVYVFRGVDPSTPLDVAAVQATAPSTSRVVPPDITPTTAGAYPVVIGAAAHNGGVDTFTSGDLIDFRTVGGNDSNDVTIGIGHQPDWSSGATNYATWGHSQTNSTTFSWAATTIALRPAAAGADDLLADDLAIGTPTLTAAALGQTHVILADDVATGTPTLTATAIGQSHVLLADDLVTGTLTLTNPALAEQAAPDELLAEDLTIGVPTLGTPGIWQSHVLSAVSLEAGAPTLGNPNFAQIHVLGADGLDGSAPTLSTPALGFVHVLLANDLTVEGPVTEQDKQDIANLVRQVMDADSSKLALLTQCEGSLSLPEILRLLSATLVGNITHVGGVYQIRSVIDPNRIRIEGTVDEQKNRVISLIDAGA